MSSTPTPAQPEDLADLAALLAGAGLPHADLTPEHLPAFHVVRDGDRLLGSAGLEVFDDGGLLRSLAVAAEARGAGLGGRLVDMVESDARRRGLPALYLLTTTASGFFSARGYRPIDRQHVPLAVRAAREFTVLCPSAAQCLWKPLTDVPAENP